MKRFLIILGIAAIIAIGGLTNYKNEILYCSKTKNECRVEKTNLYNMKFSKKIVDYSDIKKVSYIRQKVRGNLYAKGYTDYRPIFVTRDNSRKIIFSEVYFNFDDLKLKMAEIRKKMHSDEENFVIYKK